MGVRNGSKDTLDIADVALARQHLPVPRALSLALSLSLSRKAGVREYTILTRMSK